MDTEVDVVTGATGQVGMELCRALVRSGRTVRGIVVPGDPMRERLAAEGVDIREANVLDYPTLRVAFEGARHVYHLAAVVSVTHKHDVRLWRVNVEGPRNAARAAREVGARRFVYFSSIVVFDPDPLDELLDETRHRLPAAVASPYVRSKIVGEQVVREFIDDGLDGVIVHPTVVIGAHETHHVGVVHELLFRYFNRRLPTVFTGGFNSVSAADVAAGAIAAIERGKTGESYILGGEWATVMGLVKRIKERVADGMVPRVAIPLALARAGLPLVGAVARLTGTRPAFTPEQLRQLSGNPHISSAKAERELGYRPDGLDAALRSVHEEWLRLR